MPWMLGIARNCEPHSTAFNKNSTWHLWNACCCDQRLHKSIQRWNACYAIRSLCFADLAQNGSRRVLFERNHPPKRLGFQASESRNGSRWTLLERTIMPLSGYVACVPLLQICGIWSFAILWRSTSNECFALWVWTCNNSKRWNETKIIKIIKVCWLHSQCLRANGARSNVHASWHYPANFRRGINEWLGGIPRNTIDIQLNAIESYQIGFTSQPAGQTRVPSAVATICNHDMNFECFATTMRVFWSRNVCDMWLMNWAFMSEKT